MSRYKQFIEKITKFLSVPSTVKMPPPHLAAGSKQPPRVDGKIRLYSMELCPYAQRSRLILNAKHIPHDIVNIDLVNKPDWFLKLNPQGKVPAIDTGSEVVNESLVIADFLDEKYPEYPLYPQDPEAKRQDQELINQIESVASIFYRVLIGRNQEIKQNWEAEFGVYLQKFESELAKRGKFFGGNKPVMVDYMLWPWGERSYVIPHLLGVGKDLFHPNRYPQLRKWREAMLEDPPSKETYYGPEVHLRLIQFRINKQPPNYDKLMCNL